METQIIRKQIIDIIMNEKYLTTDLYLAAYLKLKGHKIEMEKLGKKVNFYFQKTENLNTNVIEYLNEEGSCNPLKYANSVKNLKNVVYNL